MSILLVAHVPASCIFVILVVNLVPAHSCMAMVSANVVSASAAAAFLVASASSSTGALGAIATSFALFAKVAMTGAFYACLAAFACLILSCLIVPASAAAMSLSASRSALRSKFC